MCPNHHEKYISDDNMPLDTIVFKYTNASSQNVLNNTNTQIDFATAEIEKGSNGFGGSNDFYNQDDNLFYLQKAGIWLVVLSVDWDSNATGIRQIRLKTGASTIVAYQKQNASSSGSTYSTLSAILGGNPSVYLEAYQNSGGTRTVDATKFTSIAFYWMGPN